jgi:pilus assembly protein CpaE
MSNLAFDEAAAPDIQTEHETRAADAASVRPVPRISIQAFCETPEVAARIEAAAGDRRMGRAHVKVHMGGIAAAVEFYGSAPTPNLIMVESRQAADGLVGELERLAQVCDPGSKVVVIGAVNDVTLYRQLSQRGISEYLVTPVNEVQIIKTVADLYVEPGAEPLGRTIAFIGGKGGVGSSMLAHNVAWAIAKNFANDVVLADLDLAFGTAGLDFNQDPTQGIADALNAPQRVDETFLDRLLARCSEHLSLLAAPATLDRTYDFDEAAFEPVIDIAQSSVPTVVLDLPHMWSGWVRKTLIAADEIVLTCEPDLANLRNAKNFVDLLKQGRHNDAPPRLVLNRSGMPKRPEIKAAEFASAIGLEPIAVIPFEAQLFGTAANNGQMIAETDGKSPIVGSFEMIAKVVTGRNEIRRPQKSGLFSKLRSSSGKKKSK